MKVSVNLPNQPQDTSVEVAYPFQMLDSQGEKTKYRKWIQLGLFKNGTTTTVSDTVVVAQHCVPEDVVVGQPGAKLDPAPKVEEPAAPLPPPPPPTKSTVPQTPAPSNDAGNQKESK